MDAIKFLIIISLLTSFGVSILLVITKRWHGKHTFDPIVGTQKFHSMPTPRVGGLAIFIALTVTWLFSPKSLSQLLGLLVIAALPAFSAGLIEDITKRVGVRDRLLATVVTGVLAWWLTGYSLNHIEIWGLDYFLLYLPFSVVFTAIAVSGVANSINIIDGFNGLAGGTLMICFSALGLIAWNVGDLQLAQLCVLMVVIVGGFIIVNFPFGKIFLGDGGAYMLGFFLAWFSVMLPSRNPTVSVWAPLLICAYPIIETIYSMGRRYKNNASAGDADTQHLHSLIKIKIIRSYFATLSAYMRNSLVAPFCWLYAIIPALLATIYYDNTAALAVSWIIVFSIYVILYKLLLQAKIPEQKAVLSTEF
ncbi:MAG: glycosyl transferase [Chlorobiaceae bacterium]|nr:glycosyl transferase [Chlorobiaceae bacterium]